MILPLLSLLVFQPPPHSPPNPPPFFSQATHLAPLSTTPLLSATPILPPFPFPVLLLDTPPFTPPPPLPSPPFPYSSPHF
ncbi:unnamed protein product [Closterium sp. NIES-54]